MHKSLVIVAGGSGRRMGSMIPKQFLSLAGKPVLMHTIQRFLDYDKHIRVILVLPIDQVSYWDKLCIQHNFTARHKIAVGGETRYQSVRNGFKFVEKDSLTGIHDGVRPLVSPLVIANCYEQAELHGSAIPCISVNETVRQVDKKGSRVVNRENLKLIQTPQVFQYELLENALRQEYSEDFTDDATVVEAAGYTVNLTNGNPENIKITTPADLKLAEFYLSL
jgi:2-C-methyl-D-erythritol 4-phosphate cytidylyltransferase